VEQDALALWESVRAVADECLAGGARPAAVAVTNQREAAVLWERRTGRPLGPVVGWQCRRTAGACEALRRRGREPRVRRRTGLTLDPMFSATKMSWLLDQVPEGRRRAAQGELCLGTVDAWLLWNLTGGAAHATDVTNASRTLLLDLARLAWDAELADRLGVPLEALPDVLPSSGAFGETVAVGRLPAGCRIAAIAGDSHAALCGQGAFRPGAVKATYGTGSSLMTPTARLVSSARGLSSTVAWAREAPVYALEGNIPVTGGALDWLAGLTGQPDAGAVLALAATVPDTAGVHFVPALAGLGAPHWDANARGIVAGLTRATTAAHVARAALEGIAFQIREVFDAMEADAGMRFEALLADGGGSRSDLLMQLQADLVGRPVLRTSAADGAAVGVALLAGLEIGLWPSVAAVEALPRPRDRFEPRLSDPDRDARHVAWREVLDVARGGAP
jgi:glycerol kinase